MIDFDSKDMIGISASLAGALVALNYVIRMFSRGRVEGKRDSAEVDIIKTLQDENRLLREQVALAYKQRDAAIDQLSDMKTEMALLKRDLLESEARLAALKARIEELDRRKN